MILEKARKQPQVQEHFTGAEYTTFRSVALRWTHNPEVCERWYQTLNSALLITSSGRLTKSNVEILGVFK